MEILTKIGSWANKLTEIGISVIALGVVLEVELGGNVEGEVDPEEELDLEGVHLVGRH